MAMVYAYCNLFVSGPSTTQQQQQQQHPQQSRHFSVHNNAGVGNNRKASRNSYDGNRSPPTYKENKTSLMRQRPINAPPKGLAGAPGYSGAAEMNRNRRAAANRGSKKISVSTGDLSKGGGGGVLGGGRGTSRLSDRRTSSPE